MNTPPAGGAVALLPCPFCGSPAEQYEYDDHAMRFVNYGVGCSSHACPAELYMVSTESREDADRLWNTRPATVPLDAVRGLVARLDSVTRYEAEIGGGCECCGSWVEHEIDRLGDWIKYDDLKSIRDELEALTRGEGNG